MSGAPVDDDGAGDVGRSPAQEPGGQGPGGQGPGGQGPGGQEPVIRTGDRLSPAELYGLLALRAAVFVVEQAAAYQDLDGLDLRSDTVHLWFPAPRPPGADGVVPVAAAVRLLAPGVVGPAAVLGRVVTDPAFRHRGLARRLVATALGRAPRPVDISAQSYLRDFYAAFGFRVTGPGFLLDGLPHLPMRLD